MKMPKISSRVPSILTAGVLALSVAAASGVNAAVIVDGVSFAAIQGAASTGQLSLTGGSTLAAYGSSGAGTATDTQSVYTQFSTINLTVGAHITVEMTVTAMSFPASGSGFRISLSNMPASSGDVTSPNSNWASGTRQGYNLWIPTTSSGASLYREFFDLQNPLSGSGSQNVQVGASTTTFIPSGTPNTVVKFEITRISPTTIQLSGSVGATQLATVIDNVSPYFTFNTLQFGTRNYDNGSGFTLDNISIVPEPASGLLAGLGLAACLLGRRRR